jgi:hypothetical protein
MINLVQDFTSRYVIVPCPILCIDIVECIEFLGREYGLGMDKVVVVAVVGRQSVIEEILKRVNVKVVVGRIGNEDLLGEFPGMYFGCV